MVFPPQRPGMFGPMSPFQRPGNFPVPSQGTGNGLTSMLKGIFGAGNTGFTQTGMPFSSMAQTGVGSGGFAGSLQNIQQILKMVETTAPMIKQYGPMVRNLPAMFKMMKALSSMESGDDDNSEESVESEEKEEEGKINEPHIASAETPISTDHTPPAQKQKRTGESVPLLYI
ncbi:VrrA/YqfQ family protein [Virgibacillus halophilus]|uniref:VrrA/YqfQ family protein n=1 Tax=Tigheibacillus halophilus TaxID=361280 RepID=UPI003626C7F7